MSAQMSIFGPTASRAAVNWSTIRWISAGLAVQLN
jgi:hypothetical protein